MDNKHNPDNSAENSNIDSHGKNSTYYDIDYRILYNSVMNALNSMIKLSEKEALGAPAVFFMHNMAECEKILSLLHFIDKKTELLLDDKYSGIIEPSQFKNIYGKYRAEKEYLKEQLEKAIAKSEIMQKYFNAALCGTDFSDDLRFMIIKKPPENKKE
ncbi:MAG: hypothetical protein SOZ34_10110 [Clostridia bacterium]|nr:hypothetical protein [Clostridia bacterium]